MSFDVIREIIDKVKSTLKKGDVQARETIAQFEKAEQLWKDAMKASVQNVQNTKSNQTQKNTADMGDVKYSIKTINGKQYVEAERQIIFGDDPSMWSKQIEKFINQEIRQNKDMIIPTSDGHLLVLTERSAYKLSDRHRSSIRNKAKGLLTDDEMQTKGNVAAHIDEIIKVGFWKGYQDDVDGKHQNDIGEDGFNYFHAFFRDNDANQTYYRITFSAALNENEETVYSIGDIQKRRFPSRNGSSVYADGALNEKQKSSNNIIYQTQPESQEKSSMQLAMEKALAKDDNTVKHSLKDSTNRELTQEQQEYFKDSKIRDKDGNLLVLYHGTGADFTVFDTKRAGQNYGEWSEYGKGIYLTPDTKMAKYYAENARGSKTKIMELYANITNPFNVTKAVPFDIDDLAEKYKLTEFDVSFLKKAGYCLTDFLREHNEDITEYLTSKGHDGLWDMERGKASQVVAYAENQVKNVDNTKPTKDPDIRFSMKGDKDILKENAKLKEINAALKEQFRTTKFAKVDKKALEKFTRQLIKDYSSQADADTTRLMLDGLYQYMANGESGESPVWEDAYQQAICVRKKQK